MSNQHPPRQGQHTVPESFLKEFTNTDGIFHEYRLKYKNIRWRYPSQVCKIRNFYDVTEQDVLDKYKIDFRYVENSFHYYENVFAKSILAKIKAKNLLLTRTECQTIAEAYVSMKYRSTHTRNAIHDPKLRENSINIAVTAIRNKYGAPLEAVKDYFDLENSLARLKEQLLSDVELPTRMHILGLVEASLKQNIPFNEAVMKIQSMDIFIGEAGENDYFFVSDSPGFSFDGKIPLSTNFGNFSQIFFPINSKQVIMFNGFDNLNHINPIRRLGYFKVNSRFVQQVNTATMKVAHEKVFCANRTYLERFITK